MMTTLPPELVRFVASRFTLDLRSIHGPAHWMRVRKNGLLLCESTGANRSIVELFALFHDSCRLDDDYDRDHGPRAANFVQECFSNKMLPCGREEMEMLAEACAGHTIEATHPDITIATCWDADRLDLWRVGIWPDPERLCTKAGQESETINAACHRASKWMEKIHL